MTSICITNYSAVCNLGNNIDEIFSNAIQGDNNRFETIEDIIPCKKIRFGKINTKLPQINEKQYNTRCNQILLHCCNQIKPQIDKVIEKYGHKKIGIIIATTNTGVDEFGITNNPAHAELGNPAQFLKSHLETAGYYAGISTACSSGSKAFMSAKNLLKNNICSAVIVGGVDAISKLPIFGFDSLEVMTGNITNPFSKNRTGINLGEAGALFIVEKNNDTGIKILGIGESSDAYHYSTPEPEGTQASNAIKSALYDAELSPEDIDYINLHGTGTMSNDLMEANAVYNVFQDKVLCGSTKPLTGHCLGAAASIEIAMCCAALHHNVIPPHIFDNEYDQNLPKIKLVDKSTINSKIKTCMTNSFGFGGTNSVIILGK